MLLVHVRKMSRSEQKTKKKQGTPVDSKPTTFATASPPCQIDLDSETHKLSYSCASPPLKALISLKKRIKTLYHRSVERFEFAH